MIDALGIIETLRFTQGMQAADAAGVQAASRIGSVQSEVIIPRSSDKLSPKFPLDPMRVGKKSTM